MKRTPKLLLALVPLIAGGVLGARSIEVRDRLLRRYCGDLEEYFLEDGPTSGIARVSSSVFTFHYRFNRNIVVSTSDGLVVVDPFSAEAAKALLELVAATPELRGKPVHTVIYSHFHQDHASGAAVLKPGAVLAHSKCPTYWKDYPASDILAPTRFISGDVHLDVGGVAIDLLALEVSHTDTLYAVFLPGERVLFTADQGFVRTIPPPAMNACGYTPGFLHNLDRLAKLDFDVWIPSHWGYGKKADLIEAREFLETLRDLCRKAAARHADSYTRSAFEAIFDEVYIPLKKRYGSWRGFEQVGFFVVMLNVQMTVIGN